MNPSSLDPEDLKGQEFALRENISIHTPHLLNGETINDYKNNVMFLFLNLVDDKYYDGDNNFYALGDSYLRYPFIYRKLDFLPGSLATIYRSTPSRYMHREYGNACRINLVNKTIDDYIKYNGTDMSFRHMTTIAYDPDNNWVWAGCGVNQIDVNTGYSSENADAAAFQKDELHRGGGIAVIDAETGVTAHYTEENSPLLNNRVVDVEYDKFNQLIWIASYKGIQYYNTINHTWNSIPEFENNFAAAMDIYIDPFSTDKIYISFFYGAAEANVVTSQIPDSVTKIFEYNKQTGVIRSINTGGSIAFKYMTKTSATTLWTLKPSRYAVKKDTATLATINTIDLYSILPETSLTFPRFIASHINSSGEAIVYIAVANDSDTNRKNYLVRIIETGYDTYTADYINISNWNDENDFYIRSIDFDPVNPDVIYIALSKWIEEAYTKNGFIMCSADGRGQTWTLWESANLVNVSDIDIGADGNLYASRVYYRNQYNQQNVSDFINYGACGIGGGMGHELMGYNPDNPSNTHWIDSSKNSLYPPDYYNKPYYANTSTYSSTYSAQMESSIFLLCDGYSMAESRFAPFLQYPATGAGGHEGHMLVFEPKSAPYAPRVNELTTVTNINSGICRIKIHSPGLPVSMDYFMDSTINTSTVTMKNTAGTDVLINVDYNILSNEIIITAMEPLIDQYYTVTLLCGAQGIKNQKGATIVNTRSNEFADQISFLFKNNDYIPLVAENPLNILVNGNFENGFNIGTASNWVNGSTTSNVTLSEEAGIVFNGTRAQKISVINGGSGDACLRQNNLKITGGNGYTIRAYIKASDISGTGINMLLRQNGTMPVVVQMNAPFTAEYSLYEMSGYAYQQAESTEGFLRIYHYVDSKTVWIDKTEVLEYINLASNFSFENGIVTSYSVLQNNWIGSSSGTLYYNDPAPFNGVKAQRAVASGAGNHVRIDTGSYLSLEAGKTYRVKFYAKGDSAQNFKVSFIDLTPYTVLASKLDFFITSGWTEYECDLVPVATKSNEITLRFQQWCAADKFFSIDDVRIYEIPSGY